MWSARPPPLPSTHSGRGDGGEEGQSWLGERGEGGADVQRAGAPRKRVIMLTAYMACLSFLIFSINTLVTLFHSMLQNEEVWTMLQAVSRSWNNTTSSPPPAAAAAV